MSKAMQIVGIILLGIFTLVIIYLMSDVRSTSELDYYLLQEVTEASMYDAVDYSYYRETGLLKVDRDMFLENFNRRFAESVQNNRAYTIKIIDFNETPPKVSVLVTAPTVASVQGEVALVENKVSGIIETIYDDFVYSKGDYGENDYDDENPNITVKPLSNNNYEITMTDNYFLRKYAIVEIGHNEYSFTKESYKNINNWVEVDYPSSLTINESIESGKRGLWIVAVDISGLWTAKPITDISPWISKWLYNTGKNLETDDNTGEVIVGSTEGTITAFFKDDRGLKSYKLQPVNCNGSIRRDDSGITCDGNLSNSGVAIEKNIDDAKLTVDGFYTKAVNDINVTSADYYLLTVKDNNGNTSKQYVIQGVKEHKIKIEYKVDGTKLTATITDTYGDLTSYKISTDSSVPSNWDSAVLGDKITVNATIDPYKTYYIHAKDNTGKTFNVVVPAKSRSIELISSSYTIKDGCTGVWSENGQEGCFSPTDTERWNFADNLVKSFQVDTNNYSKVTLSVSNLSFENKSDLDDAPNCASTGWCRYRLLAVIDGKETVIKSWGVLHQEEVAVDQDGCILTGDTNGGTITLDFNALGVKNTGTKTLEIKVDTSAINGLYYFEGSINKITLES